MVVLFLLMSDTNMLQHHHLNNYSYSLKPIIVLLIIWNICPDCRIAFTPSSAEYTV